MDAWVDGCMGGWRDAAPAPTRGAQAAARVSWGSWSSSAGVGWVFRGRGGHCGTAAPSVTGAAGSSGAAGEGRPPLEGPGRGGTARRLRDPPASAAGARRPARGWHGAPASTRRPRSGPPPSPLRAGHRGVRAPRGGGRRGLPPRLRAGGTTGTSRARDAAPGPALRPAARGISSRAWQRGTAGSPALSVPPDAAGGRRRRGRREERHGEGNTRGRPAPAAGSRYRGTTGPQRPSQAVTAPSIPSPAAPQGQALGPGPPHCHGNHPHHPRHGGGGPRGHRQPRPPSAPSPRPALPLSPRRRPKMALAARGARGCAEAARDLQPRAAAAPRGAGPGSGGGPPPRTMGPRAHQYAGPAPARPGAGSRAPKGPGRGGERGEGSGGARGPVRVRSATAAAAPPDARACGTWHPCACGDTVCDPVCDSAATGMRRGVARVSPDLTLALKDLQTRKAAVGSGDTDS